MRSSADAADTLSQWIGEVEARSRGFLGWWWAPTAVRLISKPFGGLVGIADGRSRQTRSECEKEVSG